MTNPDKIQNREDRANPHKIPLAGSRSQLTRGGLAFASVVGCREGIGQEAARVFFCTDGMKTTLFMFAPQTIVI